MAAEYKEIGIYIDRTYKVVRQDLINRFKEAGLDITPEQWVILSKLEKKNLFQTDLANLSFRDKPTVSRIIDLLAKKNLVERKQDKNDGRKFEVSLTPEGSRTIELAKPAVQSSRKLAWEGLNEEEYNRLIQLLDKIFTNYSEKQ